MSFSSILIGIGGGTGSGKTSIANKLLEEYGEGDVVVIEQDAYYRDISHISCLLYTSPSPRDRSLSRMPSSA